MNNFLALILPIITTHSNSHGGAIPQDHINTLWGIFILLNIVWIFVLIRERTILKRWISFDSALVVFLIQCVCLIIWAVFITIVIGYSIGKLL